MIKNCGDGKNFFAGILIGGLLGAIIGLLFAPKSGEATRKDLVNEADRWKSEGKKYTDRWSRQAKEGVADFKERTGKAAKELRGGDKSYFCSRKRL